MRLAVRAPASSANLGPGFDALGLALDLWNEVEVDTEGPPGSITIEGRDADLLRASGARGGKARENLVVAAMRTLAAAHGRTLPPLALTLHNAVPVARGLGSSAAALVAGLLAADRLLGLGLSDAARYSHAWQMEGHGDNVGAAHYGGAVLAVPGVPEAVQLWPRSGSPGAERGDGRDERDDRLPAGASANGQAVPDGSPRPDAGCLAVPGGPLHGLTVVVFIPEVTGATWAARAALPAHVPHPDAAHNVATASGLTVGLLTGERALLAAGMHDRLHEPYRARLFPHLAPMAEAARAAGAVGACLSGAGPTVLALATPTAAPAVAAAFARVAAAVGTVGESAVLAPVAAGAHLVGDDPSFGCRTAVGSATASLA